jgi:hypothetical protein
MKKKESVWRVAASAGRHWRLSRRGAQRKRLDFFKPRGEARVELLSRAATAAAAAAAQQQQQHLHFPSAAININISLTSAPRTHSPFLHTTD